MKDTKNRIVYYDVLNITAILGVLYLHFANEIHWYEPTVAWKQSVYIQVIFYWAVPVFFMLTGATLLNYRDRYSTKEYFMHRIKRVLIPYLIWGAVFAFVQYSRGNFQLYTTMHLNLCFPY